MILRREFYARDTLTVARELMGTYLVRMVDGQPRAGLICETEAYVGRSDKACHGYNYKRTKRTEVLFAPPGTVYVYLIYGMYHCLNFVTEPEGEPCAVLIRAVRPRLNVPPELTKKLDGPGKLCRGFSIDRSLNGTDTTAGGDLFVCTDLADVGGVAPPEDSTPLTIKTGPRIGIDYAEEARDFPWRFYCSPD